MIDGDTKPLLSTAEYIWLIGKKIFSTKKIIEVYPTEDNEQIPVLNITPISFEDQGKEYILNPVHYVLDPFQKSVNYIILCDIYEDSESPHPCNTRSYLNKVIRDSSGDKSHSLISFTQQFYLYYPSKHNKGISSTNEILGWENTGLDPVNNSRYGVGTECVSGRNIINEFLKLCMDSGILICGVSAEDDLGKWNFKVGYRNFISDEEDPTPLISSDHLIFARYLLQILCEKYNLAVDYEYKNCTLKTNFSTWATRERSQPKINSVPANCISLRDMLRNNHTNFIQALQQPSTPFKVKIPLSAKHQGYGHIEDERPMGSADPYIISSKLIEQTCGVWVPK